MKVLGLIAEAKLGSRDAMDVLVRQFMPFIISRVRPYRRTTWYDDVRAHAMLGFMQAVMHFRPEKEVQITTYARFWIDAEVLKCIRGFNLRGMQTDQGAAAKRFAGLRAIWDRSRDEDEYAEKSVEKYPTVSEKEIRAIVPMFGPPHVALEDMMHERQQDAEDDLSEAEEAWQRKEALRTAMAELPQRQRSIVQWTLLDGMTLEAVGEHLGVTKERVRQIREQAMRKLREHPAVRRAA